MEENRKVFRNLLVVAGNRQKLYEQLKRAFSGNETIQVILDRRARERRQRDSGSVPERRRGDRRTLRVDDQLRALGWAIVRIDRMGSP